MFEVLKSYMQAAQNAQPDLRSHAATVQLGETTLQQVARRLNVDPNELLAANPQIKDPSRLSPGQTIYQPLPKPAAPSKPDANASANSTPNTPNSCPAPKGDPLAASVMKANLASKTRSQGLPDDERLFQTLYGDAGLKMYQQTKAQQVELNQAHDTYEKTGQIPQTKTPFSGVEIKTGKLMTRSERYDAMLQKQGKENAEIGDVNGDNRDPEYLTKQEFHDEFWAREQKEYNACSEDNFRPGTIDKCQRGVDEKYGGPGFKEWRDAREQNTYNNYVNYQQKVENIANSGPASLIGRAFGQAIGGEKGAEIGAALGGMADTGLAAAAGVVENARTNSYESSGGLELRRENPVEVQSNTSSGPAPTPDSPSAPKDNSPAAHADTQRQPGPPPDPPAAGGNRARPLDSTVRQGPQTVDTSSPGSSSESGSESVGTGQPATPVRIAPVSRPADSDMVNVNTSGGTKQMTAGEYRQRYEQARQWVSEQLHQHHWRGPVQSGPPDHGELYRQAADKFGLDRNWNSVTNPIIYGK